MARDSADVLRPAPPQDNSRRARIAAWAIDHIDLGFRILRAVRPIATWGNYAVVTRYEDVQEVLSRNEVFLNPYNEKLDVIMGGHPFFLGMSNTEAYTRDTSNMRLAMRRSDIDALKAAVTNKAESLIASSGGRIEVVDFIRTITFDVLCRYFGTPGPSDDDLRVWATRLFEFQFADGANDAGLRAEVDVIAPKLRAYMDGLIVSRRKQTPIDDVLGRCLEMQAAGLPGMDDASIRTSLIGFIVGGLPQPPMVVPQAMEQLMRRPDALALASRAAATNDDSLLAAAVFEAMRFDPLTPALLRRAADDYVIAAGAWRSKRIRKGMTVIAAVRSAMRDGRRVPKPGMFDPARQPYQYMHFGYGLHTCFGIYMNQALLPLMLKPLLRRAGLKRANGPDGRLAKRGIFADRLVLTFNY